MLWFISNWLLFPTPIRSKRFFSIFIMRTWLSFLEVNFTKACMHAKLLQSCQTLWDPMDYSPPGSSVQGILQTRILEWVAMPFSRGSSPPRDQTQILCLLHWQVGSLLLEASGKPYKSTCLVAQSCPTLGDPMDWSLSSSSVHGDSPGQNTGVGSLSLLQGQKHEGLPITKSPEGF